MDFRDSEQEAAFRQQVRKFIDSELPDELSGSAGGGAVFGGGSGRYAQPGYWQALNGWLKKMNTKGWVAPAWPAEYGGGGLSVIEQFILNEELATARAPRSPNVIALGWVGPTLILYGSEEQKQQHLPPILKNEVFWCQGFSEPGAGSDLASLQTRAVRDGDDYVINGQKIWTSGAQHAQWMNLLARTDPDAPKHKGISYFLVDMQSPGISVRPLVNMVGNAEFSEVFFDNLRVPKENLLGEENRGWYLATTTLDFERSNIASTTHLVLVVRDLCDWASEHANSRECSLSTRPALRYELADRVVEAEIARLMSYRVISMQNAGLIPNKESSVAKLYGSELEQRIALTGMRVVGLYSQLLDGGAPIDGTLARMYLYAVALTIGGGTSEIQRNIVAMRGLGMPRM